MGGEDSDHYKSFQSYCCQAYNWLRKSANLILNMLSLMVNASIPDLSVHEDPSTVLKKIEEKFRLDLTGRCCVFITYILWYTIYTHEIKCICTVMIVCF
jgi:phosphatidylinositol kinase/protein kinase (PI-3  family)